MTRTIALKEIGTPRLVIRPLNEEDIPNIYGIMSDYETAGKAGFKPLSSTSEAEGFFRESIRTGTAYGMTLRDKPSDIFGIILLNPEVQETGAGSRTETVEIGYFMRADMRGNGYMPESVAIAELIVIANCISDFIPKKSELSERVLCFDSM